jgi:hypothetical protein
MERGPWIATDGFLDALAAALRDRPVGVHGDLARAGAPVETYICDRSSVPWEFELYGFSTSNESL